MITKASIYFLNKFRIYALLAAVSKAIPPISNSFLKPVWTVSKAILLTF